MVYDITSEESFANIDKWINSIREVRHCMSHLGGCEPRVVVLTYSIHTVKVSV